MADSETAQRVNPAVIAVICVLVVAIGVLTWWLFRPAPEMLPADEAVRLVRLRNLGLGHLENERFDDSDPVFVELAEQLPAEPLGPRNLTVSRLLALDQIDAARQPEQRDTALAAAREAHRTLEDREGDTAVVHLLAARIAVHARDEASALERLGRAVELDPENATLWFELYQVRRASEAPQVKAAAGEALERAFALQPDNLFVVVQWLRHHAGELNERLREAPRLDEPEREALHRQLAAEYADFPERLERVRETVTPFAPTIEETVGVDVLELVEAAQESARREQWAAVPRHLGLLGNVLVRDGALDRLRIEKHPLEYVLDDFSPQFYERAVLPDPADVPPIEVRFVAVPSERQLSRELQQELDDVKAVSLADFNLDGRLDLIVLDARAVRVYGRPDGKRWELLAEAEVPAGMTGLRAVDLDLDFDETALAVGEEAPPPVCPSADIDLVVYGEAGIMVFENRFDPQTRRRELVEVPQDDDFAELTQVLAVAMADLDGDGDLDLVVSTEAGLSLWSNRGNMTFFDISHRATLPPADWRATALLPVDWDRNVALDLIVAGEHGAGWLENLRHGRFRWRPFEGEWADVGPASALGLIDADQNASWDLLAGGERGITLTRTRTPMTGVVQYLSTERVADVAVTGLLTWDYDNDGLLDLLVWNGGRVRIVRGLSAGRFEERDLIEAVPQNVVACDFGDLENDGDLDLVVAEPGRITFFHNEGGNRNHWIDVALQAQQVRGTEHAASGRVNAHGLGSLLELKAGPLYQPQAVERQVTHFGLGRRERADVVRVLWTNGIPHNILEPQRDQFICERQALKGSCPYLYTWDGEKFVFVTDLLWAAPIGLQFAEGVLAPSREWEYIKIPGELLAPRNGEYVLQITEELWEAAYFDEVKLIAVDRPADVEIHTNEKVGPAEIAEFRIHTVRERRPPVAARDHRGRDVLDLLVKEDEVYLKAFDRKLRQGLVEQHFIELDLGELDDAERITLFLTGWVYPTDTSLNVALSQNPDLPSPRPPSLWVPDADGEWREALPFMGFPGGKTKTIAVDLSDVFLTDDYRLRIVTNMEFYWDAAFFTVDERPADHRLAELELLSADLHYRGFSEPVLHPHHGPDRYDYEAVSTEPRWPPTQGRFTRYGDVTELLRASDDRLVVFGSGDELTLRFRAVAPPPPGWKRDFLLHSVGWDKDADLNTVHGQTVEPLPFRGMHRYPYEPHQTWPDTPRHREYLKIWQTRRQTPARFWNQLRRLE